jgi:hypothetical protein
MAQPATPTSNRRWALRDLLAAAALFLATAAFVLWQNARLAIVWDISYILDSSVRIAAGQVPYRDFPFAHAPLTFLIQAAIMRLTGHVYFHHLLYAALAGGAATVLTWRIALQALRNLVDAAWTLAFLLAVPLAVLGIYSIFPFPFYDCDSTLSILIAVFLLQKLIPQDGLPARGAMFGFVAGFFLVVPVFVKQNIGLPFLVVTLAAILVLLAADFLGWKRCSPDSSGRPALLGVLAGMFVTLAVSALVIQRLCGLSNYIHWTVRFAAERRLPGFADMVGVYAEPSLLWFVPCVAIALVLVAKRSLRSKLWARILAGTLLAAPFLWVDVFLLVNKDSDDRASSLLALWPLLLILAIALTVYSLRNGPTLRNLLPVILLATIHGTLLSQQLWGSTYAIWPLLILLVAEMIAFLGRREIPGKPAFLLCLTGSIAATLLLCGSLYAASLERLSYVQLQDGPLVHAMTPSLAGMATRGAYLPAFDQLLQFAKAEIPVSDGLLLLPGEDPFYFATGRVPQFPVLLFDRTTDPYSPEQIAEMVRSRGTRWLIEKRQLQLTEDPMPQRAETLRLLGLEFAMYRRLDNYDVYRRR